MEETVLPQTQEGSGYESTRVRQFTIFLDNKVGRLQSLVRALESGGARIAALIVEESADSALVRVVATQPEAARAQLQEFGYPFNETDLLAVELPLDAEQPMFKICTALMTAEIFIHAAYPLLLCPRGPAVVLYVDDPTLAARLLLRKGFTLIGESDLAG